VLLSIQYWEEIAILAQLQASLLSAEMQLTLNAHQVIYWVECGTKFQRKATRQCYEMTVNKKLHGGLQARPWMYIPFGGHNAL